MALSLKARALLAVALMIGFYLLALGIVAALLSLVYLYLTEGNRPHIRLIIFYVGGAFAILGAIRPRVDHFVPPGPRLTPESQPRLFEQMQEIAQKIGQPVPAEVYLIADTNTALTTRGGVMGFGSRRVMVIGLTLVQAITVSQLRSELAHEFGHFHQGDVALGSWIYKTYRAIERTMYELRDNWLDIPFKWYIHLFLRLTRSVARQQEYAADALAARVVGVRQRVEGEMVGQRAYAAFKSYWTSTFVPLLNVGFRAPFVDGFSHFISHPHIAEAMEAYLQAELRAPKTHPYDSHPPLRDRITALQALPVGPEEEDDTRSAITLLDDVPALEKALLTMILGEQKMARLTFIAWEEAGARAYLTRWQQEVEPYRAVLASVRVGDLATFIQQPNLLINRIRQTKRLDLSQLQHAVNDVVSKAFAVALTREGWSLTALPGEPLLLRRGEMALDPLNLGAYLRTEEGQAKWAEEAAEVGVSDILLVPDEAPPTQARA